MATARTPESEARRVALLASLKSENVVRLAHAAAELGVSHMTIRRDLKEMEQEGLLRRVRGGAMSIIGPQPFAERRAVRLRAKEAIAEKALALVPRHGAIALDASTTAGTLAMKIGPSSGLIVASNSYPTYLSLRNTAGVTSILLGGETEEITESFVGPIAVRAAESLRYVRFFASASALDSEFGTSEVSLREADVKRAFYRVSRELVLCVDSSKLEQHSVAAGFVLDEVKVLITELDPKDGRLGAFRGRVELL